jgi:ribosomal protein S27E
MKGIKCKECKNGEYQETGIFDAWDGVLHCNRCGHEIKVPSSTEKKDEEQ